MLCVLSCLVVSDSATPWTVAHQAPLCMGFFRQEHWSGLPFASPGDLPNSGIKLTYPVSPALEADSSPAEPSGKPTRKKPGFKTFIVKLSETVIETADTGEYQEHPTLTKDITYTKSDLLRKAFQVQREAFGLPDNNSFAVCQLCFPEGYRNRDLGLLWRSSG